MADAPQFGYFGFAALAVCTLLAGCAASPHPDEAWEERALEGERAYQRGELDRAESTYRELLETADDPDDESYALLQLAKIEAERGRDDRAYASYLEIGDHEEYGAHAARGLFKAALLAENELERPDDAERLRRRVVREFPNTSWADITVDKLADQYAERGDWAAFRRDFRELHDAVVGSEVAENVLFALAERLEDAGRRDPALALYREVARRYPEGTLGADAEWEAARLLLAKQNWSDAIELLERTARRTEPSWLIGNLNSPYASRARFRLGYVHLVYLDDYGAARRHFDQFARDFPTDRLVDDAAWHRVQTYRLEGEDDRYEEALREFLADYPDSRWTSRARKRLDALD